MRETTIPAVEGRGAVLSSRPGHDSQEPLSAVLAEEAQKADPRLTPLWRAVVVVLTMLGVLVAMNHVFYWNLFGYTMLPSQFLYIITALFVSVAFIVHPVKKRKELEAITDRQVSNDPLPARPGVPWYDVLLVLLTLFSGGYFAVNAVEITEYGWAWVPPGFAVVMSFVVWALVLEVLRRTAGWVVFGLAAAVSVYPVVAGVIPVGFLQGIQYDVTTLAANHVMGVDSIFGLPLQTAGTVLIGFLAFGVVLQHTGGADFFHNLSSAMFGRYRGGTAKVAVASSATMGMMSGSAVSNVLTTGPMTIPAMVKGGFSRKTAGAVEATASSGGSITPPIMGTAAFLMVSFAEVPYTDILVAATIPAFLYFLGIFLQIDGYAALRGLHGTPKELLPKFGRAVAEGWPYLGALAVLTGLLFVLPSEAQVPYFVVGLLIVIALVRKSVTFGPRQLMAMLVDLGKTLGQIIAIIAGVGLILGGLTATGVALSLSRDLVALVGENVVLILIAGALACFVLGMGLTISAAYVFLAIVMVPAVTALGVNVIAAHLFVIYWASVSYITPPVGLAAFAAAGISGASAMGTAVEAMRLGLVKYVVPFGFALNPALVAQAPLPQVLVAAVFSVAAVYALAAAFSGFAAFVEAKLDIVARVVLAVGGFMMFLPGLGVSLAGAGIVTLALVYARVRRRPLQVQPVTGVTPVVEASAR